MWLEKDREQRVIAWRNAKLAIAFVGLNILDAALTMAVINKGGFWEFFPIMRQLLEQPVWVFWTTKISLTLVFALALLIFSNKYPRPIHRIFLVLIIAMLGVCLFNGIGLVQG